MFEIDKNAFGSFLSEQRKEKGYTQRELAEKLFVSDKAVSKWERGVSMPDISLLVPLSEILDVSVTELLEGRRMDQDSELDAEHVEQIVKKALAFSEDTPEKAGDRKKKRLGIFCACALVTLIELAAAYWCLQTADAGEVFSKLIMLDGLLLVFGIYICFFVKEYLPSYYDENSIHTYSDGIFRMNIPGINLNNSNWPYLLKVIRVWLMGGMMAAPAICMAVTLVPVSGDTRDGIWKAIALVCVIGVLLHIYIENRKRS
ncbi:MAG TPA: helix-turn-helix transcriptional regulator [Candidatus Mediterraneibacter vanvlietii]|nr:helix-turn-helix transcriptional regulator [Candidatus Mediterraneibacter vanvlietii]